MKRSENIMVSTPSFNKHKTKQGKNMRYLILILSLLMVGCTTYVDYEKEAIRVTKRETGCTKKISISLSVHLNGNKNAGNYIIKTKACGKYYTYFCSTPSGCDWNNPSCQRISVESKPTEDAGKI